MGFKTFFGAIGLACMAFAGSSASAEVSGGSSPTTLAMNLPTPTLAPLQPALSAAARTFESLSAKVAATESNLAAVDSQLKCLATAIYFEARSEPVEGQLAVAQVIQNRARSGRFPSSICGVVNQPSQFSFSRRRSPDNQSQWMRALKVAAIAKKPAWPDLPALATRQRAMAGETAHYRTDGQQAAPWRGSERVPQ